MLQEIFQRGNFADFGGVLVIDSSYVDSGSVYEKLNKKAIVYLLDKSWFGILEQLWKFLENPNIELGA